MSIYDAYRGAVGAALPGGLASPQPRAPAIEDPSVDVQSVDVAEDDPFSGAPGRAVVVGRHERPVNLEGDGVALAGAFKGCALDVEAARGDTDGGRLGGGTGGGPRTVEGLARVRLAIGLRSHRHNIVLGSQSDRGKTRDGNADDGHSKRSESDGAPCCHLCVNEV